MLRCILQLTSGHRTVILSAMEKIIKQKIDEIDNELTLDTIRQASAELTASKVSCFYFILCCLWHDACLTVAENSFHCSGFNAFVLCCFA